jgi:ABC-2 type transport system permease protein
VSSHAYRALTIANFKLYLRNPLAVSSVLLISVFLILALRFVDYSKAAHVKVSVVNQAHTAVVRDLLQAIQGVSYFDVTRTTRAGAIHNLSDGTADLAVIIPASPNPASGPVHAADHATQVLVVRNPGAAADQGLLFLQLAVDRAQQQIRHAPPAVTISSSVRQTKGLGILDAFLPGLLAMNIIQSGLLLAAGAFATYRATGVLRRIQATGTGSASFVLAHATASFVLGLAQAGILLAAAVILFSLKVDVAALLAMTALGYLVFLAMGFAISGWIADAQRAPAVAASIGMPMMFLAFFPPEALPQPVTFFVGLLPITFMIDGIRHIGQGGGLESLTVDLLSLGLWAVALLLAATRVFRWEAARR